MNVFVFPIVNYLVGKAVDTALCKALETIVQTNYTQLEKKLDAIHQTLKSLLVGDFNSGINKLAEAAATDADGKPRLTLPEQNQCIELAIGWFEGALGKEAGNDERCAWIEWHIAQCYALLNQDNRAQFHLDQCRDRAKKAINSAHLAYEAELKQLLAQKREAEGFIEGILNNLGPSIYIGIPLSIIVLSAIGIVIPYVNFVAPVCFALGLVGIVVGLVARVVLSLRQPKPVEERVSPVMQSLIATVGKLQGSPRFAAKNL
jgi:hypothetical protein